MRIGRTSAIRSTLLALAVVATAYGCSGGGDGLGGPEIVVGSFGFGESDILGEIYAQGLTRAGYPASHQAQIGPREIVKPKLESGEIGFVPEYVGSGLEVGFGQIPSADGATTRADLAEAFAAADVSVLELAPAENTNTFVVLQSLADELGLVTVSDLAALGDFTLGGPPECRDRPRCMLGLVETYGLSVEFRALDAGGPLTLQALLSGDVQVGLFFSTSIYDPSLVGLEDDLRLQPAENIVPVVRTELLEAHGDALADRINEISAQLTTSGLAELNRQLNVEMLEASEIAAQWLASHGL